MFDPVTYTAVLPVAEETVLFVSRLRCSCRGCWPPNDAAEGHDPADGR